MSITYNQFKFFGNYFLNRLFQKKEGVQITSAKKYLSEIINELSLEMHIVWDSDHIQSIVTDKISLNPSEGLSTEDLKKALKYIHKNHDYQIGLNYVVIEKLLLDMLSKNLIKIIKINSESQLVI